MKFLGLIFLLLVSLVFSAKDTHKHKQSEMLPAFSFQRRADNSIDTFLFQDSYTPVSLTQEKNLLFQKGKRTVIFFFSALCGHCQKAIPKMLELKPLLTKKGVNLIAIATRSNKLDDIYKFISKHKVKIPVFHDKKQSFARRYGIGVVPVVMIINEKGNYFRIQPFHIEKAHDLFEHILNDKALFPKRQIIK